MSRLTMTIIWACALIVLAAMIEVRPLAGLSASLLLSVTVYLLHLSRVAKRQGGPNA